MNEISKEEIAKLIGKQDPLILDIGCYDGKDSLELYNQFENPIIYCFEADPRSQQLFSENINDELKIFLQLIAIGNVDGYVDFHLSDSDTRRHYENRQWSASSSLRKPKSHIDLFDDVYFEKIITVKCTKLDSWFMSHKLKHNEPFEISGSIKIIDFIWADVNGNEGDVILGGLKTLEESTRYLYIEFSDKELYEGQITKEQILKLLPSFELLGIYNWAGNFGNILLKNKNL